MKLKDLIGSGDKIGLFVLPFMLLSWFFWYFYPSFVYLDGSLLSLRVISVLLLIPGIIIWVWSVYLILTITSKGKLITYGPFKLVKHPLYTSVSLLVLPAGGILMNTWLGLALGVVLYTGSRLYSPKEEKELSEKFGSSWDVYRNTVIIPWL